MVYCEARFLIANLFNLRNKDKISFSGWPNAKVILENNRDVLSILNSSGISIYIPGFALFYAGHDGLFLLVSEGIGLN